MPTLNWIQAFFIHVLDQQGKEAKFFGFVFVFLNVCVCFMDPN